MDLPMESSSALCNTAADLEKTTARILKRARLTKQQRIDLEAVQQAIQLFQSFAGAEHDIIDNFADADPAELQRVRHQLLNHLNIIAGFTRILVRELPDNLLLEMSTIRQINETGQVLIDKISELR
jgi:hypothetical protein